MYLYFNKLGILTTIVPHGEIPRQGSTLNIYVCLDSDFFESEEQRQKSVVNIDLVLPNDEIGTRKMATVEDARLLPFRKKTSGETVGDFIDGCYYWTYHFRFSPNESTIYAGKVVATVSIREIETGEFDHELDVDSIEEIDVKYFGAADIIVEKTVGSASFNENISQAHYANLLKQINALIVRLNNIIISGGVPVSANPKLNGDETSLESIMINGINYKIDTINQEELDEISKTIKEEIEPKIDEIKKNYALKEEIITDYNELKNKPIINQENDDVLYITDLNGNVLAKFDNNGLHTIGVSINGKDVLATIEEVKDNIVVDYNELENKPIQNEDKDDTLYVADSKGYVIAKFDKTGFYTTSIFENGEDISIKYASKQDLAIELAKLVDSSPEALNTLNELAAALGNNPNFATDVINLISEKLGRNEQAVDSARLGGILYDKYALKEEIVTDYNELENKPIENEENDDTLYISDLKGNIIARFDSGGFNTTNIYSNGKEVALKEMTFTGTWEEFMLAESQGIIPIGAIVNIIDDDE